MEWYKTYIEGLWKKNKEKEMPNRVVAVFNTNHENALVMRLVYSPIPRIPRQNRTTLTSAEQEKVIRDVQDNLPKGHKVVGISNEFPGQYGSGGVYVYPVRISPPPKPRYEIEVGPSARNLENLKSVRNIEAARNEASRVGDLEFRQEYQRDDY